MSKNKKYILFACLIAVLFLFKNGYMFNQSDQEEHLPMVYQMLEPGLYPVDFFVQAQKENFTVREYYVLLIGNLARIIPLNVLCFLLQLLCTAIAAFGLMKITERFGGSGIAPYATLVFAVLLFNNWTVGGNNFESNILISTSLANPFVVFSIYYFLLGRNFLAGSLAGVAALFQVLMGLHIFLLLGFALIAIARRQTFKKFLELLLGFFIFSSAMLIPVFVRQFAATSPGDTDLFYRILYEYRNHLHYLPSLFPIADYLKLGSMVLAAYFVSRWIFLKKRKFLYTFSVAVLAGMLVYYIGLELLGIHSLGKLQWFKTAVLLNVFCCIIFGLGIGSLLNNTVVPFRLSRLLMPFFLICIFLFSLPLIFSAYMPIDKLKHRYKFGQYPKSDLEIMHQYIYDNTNEGVVVLTSPDNDSFLCESKRNTPFSFKAVIHEPFYLLEWFRRLQDLYEVSELKPGEIVKEATELYNNSLYFNPSNPYKIDFRIIDMQRCSYLSKLQKPVFISGSFGLFPYQPARP